MLQRGALLIEGRRAALGSPLCSLAGSQGDGRGYSMHSYGEGGRPCRGDAVCACYIPFSPPHIIMDGHRMSAASRGVHGPAAQCCPRGCL